MLEGSKSYECIRTHVSPEVGTFFDLYNLDDNDTWQAFVGKPINWDFETPWSDMKQRGKIKLIRYINLDTQGTGEFDISAFVNTIKYDPQTNDLIPVRAMQMQAGDAGGWGTQFAGNYGGGRRTREAKLWPFSVRGKNLRWRYSGSAVKPVRIISHTMHYTIGGVR